MKSLNAKKSRPTSNYNSTEEELLWPSLSGVHWGSSFFVDEHTRFDRALCSYRRDIFVQPGSHHLLRNLPLLADLSMSRSVLTLPLQLLPVCHPLFVLRSLHLQYVTLPRFLVYLYLDKFKFCWSNEFAFWSPPNRTCAHSECSEELTREICMMTKEIFSHHAFSHHEFSHHASPPHWETLVFCII